MCVERLVPILLGGSQRNDGHERRQCATVWSTPVRSVSWKDRYCRRVVRCAACRYDATNRNKLRHAAIRSVHMYILDDVPRRYSIADRSFSEDNICVSTRVRANASRNISSGKYSSYLSLRRGCANAANSRADGGSAAMASRACSNFDSSQCSA